MDLLKRFKMKLEYVLNSSSLDKFYTIQENTQDRTFFSKYCPISSFSGHFVKFNRASFLWNTPVNSYFPLLLMKTKKLLSN